MNVAAAPLPELDARVTPGPAGHPVRDLLLSLRDGPTVNYLPNPGNGGDALINVGFFDVAHSIGLRYRVIDRSARLTAQDVLIIAGGGGLVPEHEGTSAAVAQFNKTVGTLIVLPQTARENDDLLRSLGGNVHLFLRERMSYDYCLRTCDGPRVGFDHDMAFYADIGALKQRRGLSGFELTPRNGVSLALLTALKIRSRLTKRLVAFRVDKEARDRSRGSMATDVSKLCSFGTRTESQCYFAASQFVRTIDGFHEIHTDRLHVAIAAARLGKRTMLYDNSYFKCRAVFEASLTGFDVEMRSFPEAEAITENS
ncbi:MAG: polysaccharide pyruvyl transferase family protein [Chloroflexota bacterium]